jgi:hypothetical protein
LNRESESSHRRSLTLAASGDALLSAAFDPWKLLRKTAVEDADGFLRSVAWLHLCACSGVDIPPQVFLDLADTGGQHLGLTMEYTTLLVRSALYSAWMKSRGRPELQRLVAILHTRYLDVICERLRTQATCSETYVCYLNLLMKV